MFGNITYIDGAHGIYDGKINNNSVRYARNAVDNYLKTYSLDNIKNIPDIKGLSDPNIDIDTFQKSISEFEDFWGSIPNPKFKMKYAENSNGKPDTMAVLGVSYEELGGRTSISVDELTEILRSGISDKNKEFFSADSLDLDDNGQIDIAEYGASIIVEDMLSSDPESLKTENINGEITSEGQQRLLSFASKQNYDDAKDTYKAVYDTFNLQESQQNFINDKNNLINN